MSLGNYISPHDAGLPLSYGLALEQPDQASASAPKQAHSHLLIPAITSMASLT